MSITVIANGEDIPVGKFVCAASSQRDHCTWPRLVTQVSGARVYYVREDKSKSYMRRQHALYLCDTEEEGIALCNLLLDRATKIDIAKRKAAAEACKRVMEEFSQQVKELLS